MPPNRSQYSLTPASGQLKNPPDRAKKDYTHAQTGAQTPCTGQVRKSAQQSGAPGDAVITRTQFHTAVRKSLLGPALAAAILAPIACLAETAPSSPAGAAATVTATAAIAPPAIVVGFLGGRVKKANHIHREVQLATQLRAAHPVGVYTEVFQNDHGKLALQRILHLLDTDHNGTLSPAEKQRAHIILYGHSWGASQTVALAQQLDRRGIPVQLAILVDRVAKIGEINEPIPANVAEAVNFYQLNGLLHGNRDIRAEDPAATRILGNYRLDYSKTHIDCAQFPWYARAFMGPHIEIENDPRVWNQVESLIDARLPLAKPSALAAITR